MLPCSSESLTKSNLTSWVSDFLEWPLFYLIWFLWVKRSSCSELLPQGLTFRLQRLSELKSTIFKGLNKSNEFCQSICKSSTPSALHMFLCDVPLLRVCSVCAGNTCSWLFMSNSARPPHRLFSSPPSLLTVTSWPADKRLVKHKCSLSPVELLWNPWSLLYIS